MSSDVHPENKNLAYLKLLQKRKSHKKHEKVTSVEKREFNVYFNGAYKSNGTESSETTFQSYTTLFLFLKISRLSVHAVNI